MNPKSLPTGLGELVQGVLELQPHFTPGQVSSDVAAPDMISRITNEMTQR